MIQLANFEEREFYVMLGKVVTSVDVTFTFQMTEEEFTATLRPVTSTLRASKFTFQATTYPEGQYIVKFVETGQTTVLATVAGFVSGNPIFATSQYNTYNDDGTSTTYVPSDDQGLVPSVSQKLRVSTVNESTDVSYVRYIKVTNGTLTDNGDNSVTIDTEGAKSLTDLTDVLITGFPANNILRFDAISAKWKNVVLDLASLADTKGTPAEGKFLQYTGGFWQPVDLDIELNDLSDVDTSNEDTFKILRYDGTNWIADNVPMVGATGISVLYPNNIATISLDANLADLNNVANLTPGAGQVLTWSRRIGRMATRRAAFPASYGYGVKQSRRRYDYHARRESNTSLFGERMGKRRPHAIPRPLPKRRGYFSKRSDGHDRDILLCHRRRRRVRGECIERYARHGLRHSTKAVLFGGGFRRPRHRHVGTICNHSRRHYVCKRKGDLVGVLEGTHGRHSTD